MNETADTDETKKDQNKNGLSHLFVLDIPATTGIKK
jgi:hypothetical protein